MARKGGKDCRESKANTVKNDGLCDLTKKLVEDDPDTWGHLINKKQTKKGTKKMSNFNLGTIKHYNSDRGFGFIGYDDGAEVFFHISALSVPDDKDSIDKGVDVEFTIEEGRKGKQAANVIIIEGGAN
jgi:CspA family cold shock protein